MNRDEIIGVNPIADFVRTRGHALMRAGPNFVTNGCPVTQHKRGHRPVMLYPATQSWSCHDCKVGGSVIDWIMREKNISAAAALRILGGGSNGLSEPAAKYDYTNESGKLLFQVCRFDPKDFRQRRPDGNGGFVWNLKDVRRVLYRLAEVIKAQTVCVCEGEKDADKLVQLGFTATCNPCGAGKWREDYSETLRGKDVMIFGDNDEPGQAHVKQVVESLTGVAKSIKRIALPDACKDVSNYIESLPTAAADESIRNLINETLEVSPENSLAQSDDDTAELLSAPASYIPPPLELLPVAVQDYVHAAAESLNVDVSFVLLPLLSALGSAIGNSRSILLKCGFVQPPIIWTGIIGRSGSRKSPALDAGCFAAMEHERDLTRQNKDAVTAYNEKLAEWERKQRKDRGPKPEPPTSLTCLMDDLTLVALAEAIEANPSGVLVKKDELSHWFAAMDQFHDAKGSDVSRWLSLHTGVVFAFDRKTDRRRFRLWYPRVCISGGIQPAVLTRVLTQDFFERGLPARFLFAAPQPRKDRWSEATIPGRIRDVVSQLFSMLFELQPNQDHGEARPRLLRLGGDASEVFAAYYNECGDAAIAGDEREEAAWSKLSGYAARLALVGQVAQDPNAKVVTGEVMRAACDLARWFGNEAVRIYALLSETREQREQRELIEFIERRGGAVYERKVMQSFTRLKNDKLGTERELTALVKAGRGEWEPVGGGPGRPARKFRLLRSSTSTQSRISRGEIENSVDVDGSSGQKITPSREPDTETERLIGDELEVARL
jgi:5S rRNA maturation endonuclease (ribonuclease M5)